uniref:(northern house mosquito) hypothetical protein n=2 Tax=Culex pipiens TaxID=7175 RepID=A0A8D8MQH4_CULPI
MRQELEMHYRSMDVKHLLVDEVEHELLIRQEEFSGGDTLDAKRRKLRGVEVGQQVFKRNFQLSSAADRYNAKYGPVYVPCVVVARRGTSSYELADENGRNLGVFSAADLRPDGSVGQPEVTRDS